MAISHVKSNTIADFTGTVTVFNSVGATQTANATDLVRPSDWNSVHNQYYTLSGNTNNASTVSGTNVVFQGAGAVTLTGTNQTIVFNAPVQSVQTQSNIQALSAGTQSVGTGTVVFADSNGVGFGLNGQTITASYTRPVVSNAIQPVGSATGSGTNTSRFAADDHVHEGVFSVGVSTGGNTAGDTRVGAGRFVFQGGNNVTLSQITGANAVNTIIISGGAGGAGDGVNALVVNGGASTATTTLTLSNSNNVSFGHNAGVITATATFAQTNQSAIRAFGVSNTGQTAGNTGVSTGIDWVLAGSGSITLSQSTAGGGPNTVWVQHPAWITTQSGQAFSADASSTFQTLTLQNSNGVSFSNNAGAVRITHDLQYTSATSAITSNALNTSASRVINIVAATNNTGGGTASLSSNVSFSAANGLTFYTSAGGAVVGSHNALTTARASNDAIGLNSAFTAGPLAMTINSSGLSLNAGSAAGTSSGFTGANISASITHNTAGLALSMSVAAPGAAAENNNINLLGANTAGNTTASGSTIGLSGINMTLSGTNNSQVVLSVPATSSLVGSSGLSISTNGSTITIYQVARSNWDNIAMNGYLSVLGTAQGNSLVSIQPIYVDEPIVFSNALIPASFNVGTAGNNSSAFMDVSASMVFYTRNASTLSSVTSLGQTMTQTWSSNNTGTVTGVIGVTLTGNNYTMTPGQYWAAVHISTTNTATGGANTTALTHAVTMLAAQSVGSAAQLMKQWGAQSANSQGVIPGLGVISTGATRASIAFSDYTVTGTRAVVAPIVLQLRGATYQ
jgi:hypothetical protein